ncbi:MAG: TIR domain-containing protein [Candidatus Aenigmarchaeota archaeon]|nr:TIR domain-containing protein [Candidatus Aenigmarchaeota archaeon]
MYDVFISHASEDKEKFVRPLATKLKEKNLSIWYDEFSLKVGDSLRKSIDYGLKESKFGVVIFSPSFFNKNWPEWELNGLIQLNNKYKERKILPVWHNVTYDEILEYSPSIADLYSINSQLGLEYVVDKLLEVIKPEGSSLQYASNILEDLGYAPPPITDEWWLDVVEYDGSDSNIYDWAFYIGPLPEKPKQRGDIIAKKVIQRKWQQVVLEKNISQTTNPERLLDVIESIPGLKELLSEKLTYTISYAPQLTIKGFGGFFESKIEDFYQKSKKERLPRDDRKGATGLTIDGLSPSCDEIIALRDPNFGYYEPALITCNYVQGELLGVSPKVYDHFEYLVWFLSNDSLWLPEKIRNFLIEGFRDWNVWSWYSVPKRHPQNINESDFTGSLLHQIFQTAKDGSSFTISRSSLEDLKERIRWSLQILEIHDDINEIIDKFISGGFIESYIKQIRERKENSK